MVNIITCSKKMIEHIGLAKAETLRRKVLGRSFALKSGSCQFRAKYGVHKGSTPISFMSIELCAYLSEVHKDFIFI